MTENCSSIPDCNPQTENTPVSTTPKLEKTPYFNGIQNAVLAYVAAQIAVSLIFKACTPTPTQAFLLSFAPLNLAALAAFLLTLANTMKTAGAARTLNWRRDSDAHPPRLWFPARLILMTVATGFTAYATHILTKLLGIHNAPQHLVSTLTRCSTPSILVSIVVMAVIVAPVTEEVLFRLGVHQTLGMFLPHWPQNIITALLFALAHGQLNTVPSLMVVGLFLQQAKQVGGIKTSIALHSTYNLLQIALIFSIK